MTLYDNELQKTVEEFPGFRVLYKSKSGFMKMIATLLFFAPRFMTDFVTTIGNQMWVPDDWGKWRDSSKAEIMRHERVHLRQQKKYGMIPYALKYIFWPLPLFYARGRTALEMEAYAESMRAEAEYNGIECLDSVDYQEFIIECFTSSAYGWMCVDKDFVIDWYNTTRANIKKEMIK